MKTLCLFFVFVFLFINNSFSQKNTQVFHVSSMPPEGILLNKDWKFQTGDNLDYAKPEYDDKTWQSIDPTLDIHKLPQIPGSGICWFRLLISVDASVLKNQLAVSIQQSGASEIYLNGKLIRRIGILSNDIKKVKAYNPLDKPISFPANKDSIQVVAVRYSLQPHIFYTTLWGSGNPALKILINTTENAFDQYGKTGKEIIWKIGIFSILSILYLAFFLSYPVQKVNLYFSSYAFAAVINQCISLYCLSSKYIELWFPLKNLQLITESFGNVMLLTAVYLLFKQQRGWMYYYLLVFGIVIIPWGIFTYDEWKIPVLLFTNLTNFDITRLAFKAVAKNKKGAWIIASGGTGFFIFWFLFSLHAFGFLRVYPVPFYSFAVISIPIAVSIYLGYDFALTNRFLQQKLTEVENLSEEKQHILAAQKEVLEQQVTHRTAELKQSMEDLKSAQSQLIQSEKMASLGELTAGIAHEIQNPLNFVNNFSEVNRELIDEAAQSNDAGNPNEVKELLTTLKNNEEKINHHGKRADAIVKGMLQHSRTSSSQKEPTDINALADEYFRLTYHGLRAKDKEFNATIKTDFDESIGNINVVPQDIGRVILNLITNAFYAVTEKKKTASEGYEPTVSVSTKKINSKVEIKVSDNGNGIPQKVLEKIFQPFFTTKPTGQGTGLGLSLSYDIVKAHGGEIKVNTREGEFTEFVVHLPVSV